MKRKNGKCIKLSFETFREARSDNFLSVDVFLLIQFQYILSKMVLKLKGYVEKRSPNLRLMLSTIVESLEAHFKDGFTKYF